jgi:WD40 repeat protein
MMELFPIAIGRYRDDGFEDLDVEEQVGRLVDILAPFGGRLNRWACPSGHRDGTAVEVRLREFERLDPDSDTVLYWVGHGWSDDVTAALAHQMSPADVRTYGVSPEQLAEPVRARQVAVDERWAIVIIDACRSDRFVELLSAELAQRGAPDRVLLIGTSAGGAASLGRFAEALKHSLGDAFKGNRTIPLSSLAADLAGDVDDLTVWPIKLGDSALVRVTPPVAEWMSAPLDTIRHLEEILDDLDEDERRHFLVKAQGAEEGEISWFFEGREKELGIIARWLRSVAHGMLVVTGPAGSGKSALLGNMLVHALPELRDALERRGLVASLGPEQLPPDNVFSEAVHLSGLTIPEIVRRLARGAGLGTLPSQVDPAAGIARDLDWLAQHVALRVRDTHLTFLVDALDEATDPLDTARSVLARLAQIPGVRIVVGTRASTLERPDFPTADENLLEALAVSGTRASGLVEVVRVTRDADAVERYVRRRLREAGSFGVRGHRVPGFSASADDMARAAKAVAGQDREFLFARLVVYELLADGTLLNPGRAVSLQRLLAGDHRDVFARALERLKSQDDRFMPLMQALALARGRGLPVEGDVWAIMGSAIAGDPVGSRTPPSTSWIPRAALHELLDKAQAYIAVDMDSGQTVYRLAHRTFVEYFSGATAAETRLAQHRHRLAALGLLANAEGVTGSNLSAYVSRHLSGHVADSECWTELAGKPYVLDRLDPEAVTGDALRTLFGRAAIPDPIAGVIGGKDRLLDARLEDRPGLRHLTMTTHGGQHVIEEETASWGVAAGRIGEVGMHAVFRGHSAIVNALTTVRFPDGRSVLVSGSDDGTVRLWDPATATPAGPPLTGHVGTVDAACSVTDARGMRLLATGGSDGAIRIWEPWSTASSSRLLMGHRGGVRSLCHVVGKDGRGRIVSGGVDGTIRFWDLDDPTNGAVIGHHAGMVWVLCEVPTASGQSLVASGGGDGQVKLWDPWSARQVGDEVRGDAGTVRGMCALPLAGDSVGLAVAGDEGRIRIWDLERMEGEPERVLRGHVGAIWALTGVRGREGHTQLASVGIDGTVQVWDVGSAKRAGAPLRGHTGTVRSLCEVRSVTGAVLIATGGADGSVRLWDSFSVRPDEPQGEAGDAGATWGFCVAKRECDDTEVLITASNDGALRVWDAETTGAVGRPLTGHAGAVWAVTSLSPYRRSEIASAGADGSIRFWDLDLLQPRAGQLRGHLGAVRTLSLTRASDGSYLLASGGGDGTVRLWDLAARREVGLPLRGHVGAVWGICTVRGPLGEFLLVSAGDDGTIRFWDVARGSAIGEPISAHVGAVWGVRVVRHSGAEVLASVGADGLIRLWNPETRQPVMGPLEGHAGAVRGVCSLPADSSDALASAGADGKIRTWAADGTESRQIAGHIGTVRDVWAMGTRDGTQLLASAGIDGTARLWDTHSFRPVGAPMGGARDAVEAVVAGADSWEENQILLTGDGRLVSWNATTAHLLPYQPLDNVVVCALRALPATAHDFLVGGMKGEILVCDSLGRRRPTCRIETDGGPILSMSPLEGELADAVVVAHRSGSISVWNLETGRRVAVCKESESPTREICGLEPLGQDPKIVTAHQDGYLRLWEIGVNVELVSKVKAHDGWVWSVCVLDAPDAPGPLVASGGADGLVRLWDPANGEGALESLSGHKDQVRVVRQVSSGAGVTALVSCSHDGTLRIWNPGVRRSPHEIPIGLPLTSLAPLPATPERNLRTGGGVALGLGTGSGMLAIDIHAVLLRAIVG